ncbi:YcaO-like family protein [Cupriavidus sp. SW-Y-13]|uniref:YcaO-like family protein n=1 Tax=Cupriavidus sp. SW-Y-13 TaxID=2653854 RepID=UPI0013663933|nr:YcaO-like family protein [Cupriavidus sp. SW-Y-13]MWL90509.1 hypothetical protein [Cupriavidus sp. SW-Y-13]
MNAVVKPVLDVMNAVAIDAPLPNRVLQEGVPEAVRASIGDPARLSPMLAGASMIQGNHLTVRAAYEDIEIDAPAALLKLVFQLCDGTRTIQEILALPAAAAHGDFGDFIAFLLDEGALIDANLAAVHANRYALQGSPFGLAASSAVSNQICRRFLWNKEEGAVAPSDAAIEVGQVPLDRFFDSRMSSYTYDDAPVSVDALHALLWSLAGVVKVRHPRVGYVTPQRTIASAGGMHLVQVWVALQRQIGLHEPGVYRVTYPGERQLVLDKVTDAHGLVPRAFGRPWDLHFATGAVFLTADPVVGAMRYRSRSLQYLFMEAGAALHNGNLSAAALGMGYATIGGYYETVIQRMCAHERALVLGSAVFGAKATEAQQQLVSRAPEIDFAWVDEANGPFSMGFHLARAKVKTPGDDRPHTWGRDTDPWMAMRKAVAEAIEREGFRQPRDIVMAAAESLPDAIDPREVVRYADGQYTPDFTYLPFAADRQYPWASGTRLVDGKPVHILAELVFSRTSLADAGFETARPYTQVTSSGCAAGVSRDDAGFRALMEVIERDAFMRHWLAQKPGVTIPRDLLPQEVQQRVAAMEAAGCTITLQQLQSDFAHVALVAAQHAGRHFTTMGTAASTDLVKALESALEELEARVYAWLHGHAPSIDKPEFVNSTEHHFELYGLRKYYRRADRVLFPKSPDCLDVLPADAPGKTLAALTDAFAGKGLSPIVVDITPTECFIEQGRTRLDVVKAFVPGLLPISFGYQREPLGMVSRVHPGSKFPHPFP